MDSFRKLDGTFAISRLDSVQTLLEIHQPGEWVKEVVGGELTVLATLSTRSCCKGNWNIAKAVVTDEKVRAAILPFEHFEAPGMDGIYPAMLEEGMEHLEQPLRNIFRGCVTLGYVISSWRKVKVVFLNLGKDDYSNPKNFRQISLTSFLLKGLERLVT